MDASSFTPAQSVVVWGVGDQDYINSDGICKEIFFLGDSLDDL